MKINLYYVEGISRIDTPSFNTKTQTGSIQDQESYFLTKLVKSIDSTFYPPHYRNSIKFDQDDLEITDNINYLSLEYNGKTYYYFIDNIDYTSTGIITLEISMDVIQTYMFDIYISSGIIERKFIDRWLLRGAQINRSYIRENVSSGNYGLVVDKQYLNNDSKEWFVVGIFTKFDKSNTLGNLVPGSLVGNEDANNDSLVPLVAPYDIKLCTLQPYTPHGVQNPPIFSVIPFIKSSAYIAETRDLFVCPFNPFSDWITFDKTNLEIYFHSELYNQWRVNYLNFDDMHGESVYYFFSEGSQYMTKTISHEVTFNFTANLNTGRSFESRFVPALLDENYILLTFGTNTTNTTFPLFKLVEPSVYCKYGFNLINGTRHYYITNSQTSPLDRYDTMVIDTNVLSIDLKNDAWAQYISANKNRWSMLVNSTTTGATETMVRSTQQPKYNNGDVNAILSNPKSYTPVRHQLSANAKRKIANATSSGFTSSEMAVAGIGAQAVGGIVNQLYTEDNLVHTPPSVKQTGNYAISTLGKSGLIYTKIEKVIDFEQCAQYYHRNGYLVNEYVTQVSNIFSYVKNRYYFDMLKMTVPEVHLHNVIEDEETVELIRERLIDGVRLWNIRNRNVIGNFNYDNVEYTFIS